MSAYKKLMIAVDLSPEASQLIDKYLQLGTSAQQLYLVHVVEPLVVESGYDLLPGLSADVTQKLEASSAEFLSKLASEYPQLPLQAQVLLGPVKQEILRFAEENQIDLIIIGTHGRHGLGMLLGSTANALLHGTTCDVLAVRVR